MIDKLQCRLQIVKATDGGFWIALDGGYANIEDAVSNATHYWIGRGNTPLAPTLYRPPIHGSARGDYDALAPATRNEFEQHFVDIRRNEISARS